MFSFWCVYNNTYTLTYMQKKTIEYTTLLSIAVTNSERESNNLHYRADKLI